MPRLHKSSWVVAALTLIVCVLIVVPGQVTEVSIWPKQTFSHGWPAEFLARQVDLRSTPNQISHPVPAKPSTYNLLLEPREEAPWTAWNSWRLWHAKKNAWKPLNLAVDIGIVLAIVGILSGAWEFRRRRRGNAFQLRLTDFFVATFIVAVAASWLGYHYDRHKDFVTLSSIQTTSNGNVSLRKLENFAPQGIVRLVGRGNLPNCFWRPVGLQIELDASNFSELERLATRLSEFEDLQFIQIGCNFETLANDLRDAILAVLPDCEIVLPDFQEPQQQSAP